MPTQLFYTGSTKRSHSVSYYSQMDSKDGSNVRIDDRPLVVNCTGIVDLPFRFTTHEQHGRCDFYLFYLTDGALDSVIGDTEYQITAGDMVIIPPGTEYLYKNLSEDNVRYLWVHFTGYMAQDMMTRFGFERGVFRLGFDENISGLFMSMMEDFIRRDEYYQESAAVRLSQIMVAMRRRLDSFTEQQSDSMSRIFESIRYIHENFRKPISNDTLAKIEHLSVSQYIGLFRRYTGTTPRSYVIELRIRSACELLRSSDLSVAQIAETVGYDDPHYFSRIFKTHREVSPEVYRKSEQHEFF